MVVGEIIFLREINMTKIGSIIRKVIAIALLVAVIVVLAVLKKNQEVAEVMSRTTMRWYTKGASTFSSWVPFMSLSEVIIVLLVIVCVVLLVLTIANLVKLRILKAANRLLAIPLIVLTVVAIYSFSCEAAYNRKKMPLPYYENEVVREDFVKIHNYFADDLNACISALEFEENGDVKGKKLSEIADAVKEAYNIVTDDYFHPHIGSVKPMASSFIYRELQITGVTISPLGEANINILNTHVNTPFTVAHELAHTKGVMREDDANQLAFYVCINSNDPYLRYSAYVAYFYQVQSMCSTSYLTDEMREDLHTVSNEYYKTKKYVSDFWSKHHALSDIGDWFNNLYIKSSGVKEGTTSYSGGTEYEFDPLTNKFYASKYQKLFFEKYYR